MGESGDAPRGLDGASIVVLGAAGGIGRATVARLAAAGAKLTLAGRTESSLQALAAETAGARVHALDARRTEEVAACVQGAQEAFGRVDGVANLVGSILLKPAHLTSDEDWDEVIATNLRSAFAAVKAGAAAMRRSGGGSIVLMSSCAARIGLANHEAIAAAKGGVQGLALAAATSYGPQGVRVNAVAPGLVETPLTERLTGNANAREASAKMHALGRIGQPDDVASMVAWLLDPAQSWMTGQILGVDGGLGTLRPNRG